VEALEDRCVLTGLTVSPSPFILSVEEGSQLSQFMVTFTDSDTTTDNTAYQATIDWGDGTPAGSADYILGSQGQFSAVGSHVYAEEGSPTITVTVSATAGQNSGQSDSAHNTVTVTDAPLGTGKVTFNATVGTKFSGQVAVFNDLNTQEVASAYQVKILWGDGQTAAPDRIVSQGAGYFGVYGSHTYSEPGQYTTQIQIRDDGGSSATAGGTANVALPDRPLAAQGVSLTAKSHVPFTGVVASFTDSDPNVGPETAYSAVIDWGDGDPTSGADKIVYDTSTNSFLVYGSRTFPKAKADPYSINVTVTDNDTSHDAGGATATALSTITVAPNPDHQALAAVGVVLTETAGRPFTAVVATFTDSDPLPGPASSYHAVIDWGDGTTPATTGSITATGGGNFTVSGSYKYTATGT
jgi:hypothetical protein